MARCEAAKATQVVRYTVDRRPPHRIDPKSKLLIIEWPSNGHDGGDLAFGNDGYLYVSSGDGSSGSDANLTGQRIDDLLAAVLRIDVDHPDPGRNYGVPKDNPFVESPRRPARAVGLRPAQPLAAELRPRVGPALGRPERAGPVGAGLPDPEGWQLRLEPHSRGATSSTPAARPAPTRSLPPTAEHPHSEARSLTGGRVYRGTPLARAGRGLRLRRLVHRPRLGDQARRHEGHLAPRAGRYAVQHHRLRHRPRRRAVRHRPASSGFYRLEPTTEADRPIAAVPDPAERDGPVRLGRRPQAPPGRDPVRGQSHRSGPTGRSMERFAALPGLERIEQKPQLNAGGAWTLPDGSVLVQTLSLDRVDDAGKPARKRIETRLLVRQQGEWTGYSYRWNAEQTDAELVPAAGARRGARGGRPAAPERPSRADLAVPGPDRVPGLPLARGRLHPGLHPAPARPRPRLRRHRRQPAPHARAHRRVPGRAAQRGPRTGPGWSTPTTRKAPLEARVESYLHVNCSTCHVNEGGGNSPMELGLDTPLGRMRLIDEVPIHDRFDINDARLVAPGSPERSVLYSGSRAEGPARCRPWSSTEVDRKAVKLIGDWIRGLAGGRALTPQVSS